MGLRIGFNNNNHANIKDSVPDKSQKLEKKFCSNGRIYDTIVILFVWRVTGADSMRSRPFVH